MSGEEKKIIYESSIKGMISQSQEKTNQRSEKNFIKPIDKSLASKIPIPKLNL